MMDCLVLPVSIWRKKYPGSRLSYRPLLEQEEEDDDDDCFGVSENLVRVVVGKEKREFFVDPFVLKESPFRVLINTAVRKKDEEKGRRKANGNNRVIFVDVDAILFEHMLWLMHNDCASLFQLNLEEIIDFYAQDY